MKKLLALFVSGVPFLALALAGCAADPAIVPVTAANQQQIASCQRDEVDHNLFVISGVGFGASSAALGGVAALETANSTAQRGLGVASAVVGGLAAIATGGAGLTSSAFLTSNCASVIGPLPTLSHPTDDAGAAP